MKVIWKYDIPSGDTFTLALPSDREFLSIQVQHGFPVMWVAVDPDSPMFERLFHMVGTGHGVPEATQANHELVFRATFQIAGGEFVFHVFEEVHRANR